MAPFPGAVFLTPILAVLLVHLSFTRRHWFIVATAAELVLAPWVAPVSIRSQSFFIYLVAFVTVLAVLATYGQFRTDQSTKRNG